MGYFVLETPYRGFAPGPYWRLPSLRSLIQHTGPPANLIRLRPAVSYVMRVVVADSESTLLRSVSVSHKDIQLRIRRCHAVINSVSVSVCLTVR